MHQPAPSQPTPKTEPRLRTAPSVSCNDHAAQETWYHGNISRMVAKERLNAQDSDCFLVRMSQSQLGKYVISVRYGEDIKHHMVCEENQFYKVEERTKRFQSLNELVAYYENRRLSRDGEMLIKPCPPPRPVPSKEHSQSLLGQGMNILLFFPPAFLFYSIAQHCYPKEALH